MTEQYSQGMVLTGYNGAVLTGYDGAVLVGVGGHQASLQLVPAHPWRADQHYGSLAARPRVQLGNLPAAVNEISGINIYHNSQ